VAALHIVDRKPIALKEEIVKNMIDKPTHSMNEPKENANQHFKPLLFFQKE
jgi:hypothetical protein